MGELRQREEGGGSSNRKSIIGAVDTRLCNSPMTSYITNDIILIIEKSEFIPLTEKKERNKIK